MTRNRHRLRLREGARDTGVRSLRIEELLREELNSLLDNELNDPALEATRVTWVELSRDGSRARIWFALTNHERPFDTTATHAAFARASGFLRTRLCDALALKRMPELRFRHDPVTTLKPEENL